MTRRRRKERLSVLRQTPPWTGRSVPGFVGGRSLGDVVAPGSGVSPRPSRLLLPDRTLTRRTVHLPSGTVRVSRGLQLVRVPCPGPRVVLRSWSVCGRVLDCFSYNDGPRTGRETSTAQESAVPVTVSFGLLVSLQDPLWLSHVSRYQPV